MITVLKLFNENLLLLIIFVIGALTCKHTNMKDVYITCAITATAF